MLLFQNRQPGHLLMTQIGQIHKPILWKMNHVPVVVDALKILALNIYVLISTHKQIMKDKQLDIMYVSMLRTVVTWQ